jgi:hypothetical protein
LRGGQLLLRFKQQQMSDFVIAAYVDKTDIGIKSIGQAPREFNRFKMEAREERRVQVSVVQICKVYKGLKYL